MRVGALAGGPEGISTCSESTDLFLHTHHSSSPSPPSQQAQIRSTIQDGQSGCTDLDNKLHCTDKQEHADDKLTKKEKAALKKAEQTAKAAAANDPKGKKDKNGKGGGGGRNPGSGSDENENDKKKD
jgi:hypothetical protein